MIRSPNHIAYRRQHATDPSPEQIRQYCRAILQVRAINESVRREHILRRNADIYRLLEKRGPMTVVELANLLGHTKRVVINYLNDQIAAGKVERTGRGNMPFYALASKEEAADEVFADLPSSDAVLAMIRKRARRHCHQQHAPASEPNRSSDNYARQHAESRGIDR